MKTRILIIFIILIPLFGINCKKANNDEEYRKLIIGNWIHIDKCAGTFGLGPDACNEYYTFFENGYYFRGSNGNYSDYFAYTIENRHLILHENAFSIYSGGFHYKEYEIIKFKISPFSNKDLQLKDCWTGDKINLKFNGK